MTPTFGPLTKTPGSQNSLSEPSIPPAPPVERHWAHEDRIRRLYARRFGPQVLEGLEDMGVGLFVFTGVSGGLVLTSFPAPCEALEGLHPSFAAHEHQR